ncbi:uncharacterized protein LOC125194574 [Salvia hispanica]|uniref:uncharacterized protein LOC125194574 n=1 Tax=Salvia hispanica TaxID=49212 RepID=UPI0020090D12|nr:uncharacterized protein LOC125194574 [Salvia hispanica]
MGSIDCMYWEWKNCPVAWKGQFTTGFKSNHPSMILEVVADYRLWIWHAYFGVAGSNIDINVLQSSPIFNDECRGEGPEISFVENGTQYRMEYYLADGIYPQDEGFAAERWAPEDGASSSHGVASAPIQMGVPRSNEYLIQRFADIRRSTAHDQLQVDLIEEVWARRGGGVA